MNSKNRAVLNADDWPKAAELPAEPVIVGSPPRSGMTFTPAARVPYTTQDGTRPMCEHPGCNRMALLGGCFCRKHVGAV